MFKGSTPSISKNSITFAAMAMAIVVTASTISTSAEAGKNSRYRNQAIGIGIATGIVGAAIANDAYGRERYREPRLSRWERHVIRCERAYRSYDPSSDTYIGYDGYERKCRK